MDAYHLKEEHGCIILPHKTCAQISGIRQKRSFCIGSEGLDYFRSIMDAELSIIETTPEGDKTYFDDFTEHEQPCWTQAKNLSNSNEQPNKLGPSSKNCREEHIIIIGENRASKKLKF